MATKSTTKFIKNAGGSLVEKAAVLDSAGAADANEIPALNASGVLDDSIINATVTSAPNKTVKTDATGRIDATVLPIGIGADTAILPASEALVAGDLVSIHDDAGVSKVRKADASAPGKEAWGFVKEAFAMGVPATIYFEATNAQVTGLTAGKVFLSDSDPGKATNTAPTTAGHIIQVVGVATGATSLNFQYNAPITLA